MAYFLLLASFWPILADSSTLFRCHAIESEEGAQVMRRRSVTNSLLSAKKRNKLQTPILINQYDTAWRPAYAWLVLGRR